MVHYGLKSFLRQAPNKLLRLYLADRGIGLELPWRNLGETQIKLVFEEIRQADDSIRAEIDHHFREILAMADDGAIQTLKDEGLNPHHGDGQGVDLTEDLRRMKSHLERAFWAFLTHPRVFKVARRLHYADKLSNQQWRKLGRLPDISPETTLEACNRLAAAIADHYRTTEGRGQACEVDHYERGEKLYWFAYPEDYAVGRLVFDEKHQLAMQTMRPAFEVVFIYGRQDRSLNTWLRGTGKALETIQGIFGATILGIDLDTFELLHDNYRIAPLLSPTFPLPLAPGDPVDTVMLTRLRLRIKDTTNRHITLEVSPADHPQAIYGLLNDVFAGQKLSTSLVQVAGLTLHFVFKEGFGEGPRGLNATISARDACSLKDGSPKDEVAQELLKRWGIDVSASSEDNTDEVRHPFQRVIDFWRD